MLAKRELDLDASIRCASRSLLQKAVRRGCPELVKTAAAYLLDRGDAKWVRHRSTIIIAEECWPITSDFSEVNSLDDVIDVLVEVSLSTKRKDAAALGSMGYELSLGDRSVLCGDTDDRAITIIAAAIERPKDFWRWSLSQIETPSQKAIVNRALHSFWKGGWPWDRAFLQASAFLAVTEPLPSITQGSATAEELPLWVALDKHTPQGKVALRRVAGRADLPYEQVAWLSFYCESVRNNCQEVSRLWSRETTWRLTGLGYSIRHAEQTWSALKPLVIQELEEASFHFQQSLYAPRLEVNSLFNTHAYKTTCW